MLVVPMMTVSMATTRAAVAGRRGSGEATPPLRQHPHRQPHRRRTTHHRHRRHCERCRCRSMRRSWRSTRCSTACVRIARSSRSHCRVSSNPGVVFFYKQNVHFSDHTDHCTASSPSLTCQYTYSRLCGAEWCAIRCAVRRTAAASVAALARRLACVS